jgi:hypothetical protein
MVHAEPHNSGGPRDTESAADTPAQISHRDGRLTLNAVVPIPDDIVRQIALLQNLVDMPGQATGVPFSQAAVRAWMRRVHRTRVEPDESVFSVADKSAGVFITAALAMMCMPYCTR